MMTWSDGYIPRFRLNVTCRSHCCDRFLNTHRRHINTASLGYTSELRGTRECSETQVCSGVNKLCCSVNNVYNKQSDLQVGFTLTPVRVWGTCVQVTLNTSLHVFQQQPFTIIQFLYEYQLPWNTSSFCVQFVFSTWKQQKRTPGSFDVNMSLLWRTVVCYTVQCLLIHALDWIVLSSVLRPCQQRNLYRYLYWYQCERSVKVTQGDSSNGTDLTVVVHTLITMFSSQGSSTLMTMFPSQGSSTRHSRVYRWPW